MKLNIGIPGILIGGPSGIQLVGAAHTSVVDGTTIAVTGSIDCVEIATATAGSNGLPVSCAVAGQAVNAGASGTTTVDLATTYVTALPNIAVQVPDSGPGALPTSVSASSTGSAAASQNTGASSPTSTSNGAARGSHIGSSSWGVLGAAFLFLASAL